MKTLKVVTAERYTKVSEPSDWWPSVTSHITRLSCRFPCLPGSITYSVPPTEILVSFGWVLRWSCRETDEGSGPDVTQHQAAN